MAFFLALVIASWLIAFALGSQVGFENEPATTAQAANSKRTAVVKTAASRDTVSPA